MYSSPSVEKQNEMIQKIKGDRALEEYFDKLQKRDRKLAPPPKTNKTKNLSDIKRIQIYICNCAIIKNNNYRTISSVGRALVL